MSRSRGPTRPSTSPVVPRFLHLRLTTSTPSAAISPLRHWPHHQCRGHWNFRLRAARCVPTSIGYQSGQSWESVVKTSGTSKPIGAIAAFMQSYPKFPCTSPRLDETDSAVPGFPCLTGGFLTIREVVMGPTCLHSLSVSPR